MKNLLLLIMLTGCASGYLKDIPDSLPENVSLIRCTVYEALGSNMVGSIGARGCQCYQVGKPSGQIVMEREDCKATFTANSQEQEI